MEQDLTLRIHLVEDETNTVVRTVLEIGDDHFSSVGKARRNPHDQSVPMIGEELAIARALQDLTWKVMEAAQAKIEKHLGDN
jgi:hypothetical protein